MKTQRGFFEIGIYAGRNDLNVGTLWRSAYQLGASGIFTIGKRYRRQCSDTVNAMAHVPLREYKDWEEFETARPNGAMLVGIEMGGAALEEFTHPQRAIYLLGAEDNGLPDSIAKKCNSLVSLSSVRTNSFNVAVTGSIVMYHRCFLK